CRFAAGRAQFVRNERRRFLFVPGKFGMTVKVFINREQRRELADRSFLNRHLLRQSETRSEDRQDQDRQGTNVHGAFITARSIVEQPLRLKLGRGIRPSPQSFPWPGRREATGEGCVLFSVPVLKTAGDGPAYNLSFRRNSRN